MVGLPRVDLLVGTAWRLEAEGRRERRRCPLAVDRKARCHGFGDERADLLERDLGRVVVQYRGLGREDLAERPQRHALAISDTAADHVLRALAERGDELLGEATLAHARIAGDGDQMGRLLGLDPTENRAQDLELALAADHRSREPRRHPCLDALHFTGHDPRGHRLRSPFQLQRVELTKVEGSAYQTRCGLTDHDRPRVGRLLETSREIDGVTRDQEVCPRSRDRQDLTGVDADSDLELLERPSFCVPDGESSEHSTTRSNGSQGIVLVRQGHSENGHDRVADEFLDRAALVLDLLRHGGEVVDHQRPGILWMHALYPRHGAHEVGEEHRDELQRLLGRHLRGELGAARRTETGRFGQPGPAHDAESHRQLQLSQMSPRSASATSRIVNPPDGACWRCPRHESNMRTRFRKPLLYPLSYGGAT